MIVVKLEEIENLARKIPIEEILKKFDWKDFEEVVAEIFKRNDFLVKKNFRFKTKKRYEVDIIAIRRNLVFCVDCKRWSGGKYKKSGIRKSVEEQEERTKAIRNILAKNPILRKTLKIEGKPEVRPLLVTLMEEDLIKEKNTFIVPVFKLNSFLLEIENYL
jgi:Holliday junction resolvase-like predicted endonuclease